MSLTDTRIQPTQLKQPEPGADLRLVIEHVRLLARRRAAWLDYLQEEADATREPLEDRDDPVREARWWAENIPELNTRLADVARALEENQSSRLRLLAKIFGLSALDRAVLQVCLALALDPTLGSVFAYLHGRMNRPYVTEELAARLLGLGRSLFLPADSPLWIWRLVKLQQTGPGDPPVLDCDLQVRDWLLGAGGLHRSLIGRAVLRFPLQPPESWPLAEVAGFIQRLTGTDPPNLAWIQVSGLPGSGRRTFAACVSNQSGLPLLVIDADAIPEADWEAVYAFSQRQAYLDGWALAWVGESLPARSWSANVPPFPVQFVITLPEQVIPVPPGRAQRSVRMPSLSIDERRTLWQRAIPAAAAWQPGELNRLAARYGVTPGEIAAVARQGIDRPEAAAASIRDGQRDQLGRLAQRLECSFTWSDLIVTNTVREALDDFVFEARERSIFWEQPNARRLFPHGRGLAGLFSGPPGTGKTMAAQVMAADLGLDLFRVDLSSVVSKYVGETSQNIERILSRAENMDIILFFDEADALFGKRTEIKDAHDRFANTDTNYLLQAIENYAGIILLATNKKANIEPAFIRRLRYLLEFSPPDEYQRLKIWKRIVAEMTDEKTSQQLESQLKTLAREVTVTGAQIKYAILAAIFIARQDNQPLQINHLLRGLKRELLKEGRSISEREMEKLQA
jgi:hypothetical protein